LDVVLLLEAADAVDAGYPRHGLDLRPNDPVLDGHYAKPGERKVSEGGKPGWQPDGSYLTPEGQRLRTPMLGSVPGGRSCFTWARRSATCWRAK
jgi:hypothetical protein